MTVGEDGCGRLPNGKLAGSSNRMNVLVGNLIENYFMSTGDWNFGSAISLIMAVIIMISMFITKKVDYENKGETRA